MYIAMNLNRNVSQIIHYVFYIRLWRKSADYNG
jgi:hypothetical protein